MGANGSDGGHRLSRLGFITIRQISTPIAQAYRFGDLALPPSCVGGHPSNIFLVRVEREVFRYAKTQLRASTPDRINSPSRRICLQCTTSVVCTLGCMIVIPEDFDCFLSTSSTHSDLVARYVRFTQAQQSALTIVINNNSVVTRN